MRSADTGKALAPGPFPTGNRGRNGLRSGLRIKAPIPGYPAVGSRNGPFGLPWVNWHEGTCGLAPVEGVRLAGPRFQSKGQAGDHEDHFVGPIRQALVEPA